MFQNKNLSAVRENSLFKGVNFDRLKFKFNPKYFIEVGEGEIIYQAGNPGDSLFLIIEGEVKVKISGSMSNFAVIKKVTNDFFGEKELQDNSVRKSSAVANKDTLIYRIRKNELNSMTHRSKELEINLLGYINEEAEIEVNKKEFQYNGLLEKLTEQTHLKTENIIPDEDINTEEVQVNEELKEEIDEKELNFETYLTDEIETKDDSEGTEGHNEQENDTFNVDNKDNNTEPSDIIAEEEAEKRERLINPFFLNAILKISSGIKPNQIFSTIPESISELLNAEMGKLYIIDRDTGELRSLEQTGFDYSETTISLSGNLFSKSINEDQIINLTWPSEELADFVNQYPGKEINSLIIYPLKDNKGTIVAIIYFINSNKGRFDAEDEKLLSDFSPIIAIAIENSEYVRKLVNSDRIISLNKIANFLIQDIKNPITSIKEYSEHIKKQDVSKEITLVLDLIVQQANFVADLAQTTLEYSEGKTFSNQQPTLLSNVLDHILAMLAEYVDSRNVRLFKKFEGDGQVNLDKKGFYQACFQITKNACDAMPQGGNLYIVTRRDGEKIRIEFKDEGLGIPDSIKDRIFESFMTNGKKQKSGLGLAITEKIIKENGGVIWAESELGDGAVFKIELPVID